MASRSTKRSSSKSAALSRRRYDQLLEELRELLQEGRWRAEAAVGRELVVTYHAVGTRLLGQQIAGEVSRGSGTLLRLADDLGVAVRTLQLAVAFARAYGDGPPELGLRWAHYRELIRLTDPNQRGWYETRAAQQGWSAPKLIAAIQEQRYRNRTQPDEPAAKPKARKQLRRPTGATYVYKATVERVVDGDTLIAVIDLGFQVLKRQRLRLASVDAPDLGTRKGDRAFELIKRELGRVESVIVKTNKIDLYGRYVAHVFYAPGESDKQRIFDEGQYLNQLLIDEGVAKAL